MRAKIGNFVRIGNPLATQKNKKAHKQRVCRPFWGTPTENKTIKTKETKKSKNRLK